MSSLSPNPRLSLISDGSDVPPSNSEGEEEPSSDLPSSPFSTCSETLVFKVNTSGLLGRALHVTIPSLKTGEKEPCDLYTCALHCISRPHVMVTAPSRKEIGNITFHPFSRKISLTIHGTSIEIQHRGIFKMTYALPSPALGGRRMEWQGGATSVLVDDTGKAVARLKMTRLAWWKEREVEILAPWSEMEDGRVREEVLLTAIAIMELRRRRARNAGGAGGAGGTG